MAFLVAFDDKIVFCRMSGYGASAVPIRYCIPLTAVRRKTVGDCGKTYSVSSVAVSFCVCKRTPLFNSSPVSNATNPTMGTSRQGMTSFKMTLKWTALVGGIWPIISFSVAKRKRCVFCQFRIHALFVSYHSTVMDRLLLRFSSACYSLAEEIPNNWRSFYRPLVVFLPSLGSIRTKRWYFEYQRLVV